MIPVSNEYTFAFKCVGEKTKQVYEGQFTVKCILSNQEIVEVGLRIDTYNRGSKTLPQGVQLLNRAMAELEIRTLKSPSWWKDSDAGRDLLDTNLIYELFNKAIDGERIYDERIAEATQSAEEKAEASASTQASGGGIGSKPGAKSKE
jgi:hypothetical protein